MNAIAANRRHETVARRLITDRVDATSQGPINEICRRSSGRLGGTIGYETGATVSMPSEDRHLVPITNQEGANFIASVVSVCNEHMLRENLTRLSLRTIVSENALHLVQEAIENAGAQIEGKMPIGEGFFIVYLGHNVGTRQMTEDALSDLRRAADVKASKGRQTSEIQRVLSTLETNGEFTYAVYDNKNTFVPPADLNRIEELMQTFEYSDIAAKRNATSTDNTIALAYGSDGSVVGMAVIENLTIILSEGRVLHTAELTDFIVEENNRKNKISYIMAAMLLNRVFSGNMHSGYYSVFAESNISNHILTSFSMLGGEVAGVLPNSINVVENGESRMENFAITCFNRDEVEKSHLSQILAAMRH